MVLPHALFINYNVYAAEMKLDADTLGQYDLEVLAKLVGQICIFGSLMAFFESLLPDEYNIRRNTLGGLLKKVLFGCFLGDRGNNIREHLNREDLGFGTTLSGEMTDPEDARNTKNLSGEINPGKAHGKKVIELESVSQKYGKTKVLNNLSMSLYGNEIFC